MTGGKAAGYGSGQRTCLSHRTSSRWPGSLLNSQGLAVPSLAQGLWAIAAGRAGVMLAGQVPAHAQVPRPHWNTDKYRAGAWLVRLGGRVVKPGVSSNPVPSVSTLRNACESLPARISRVTAVAPGIRQQLSLLYCKCLWLLPLPDRRETLTRVKC